MGLFNTRKILSEMWRFVQWAMFTIACIALSPETTLPSEKRSADYFIPAYAAVGLTAHFALTGAKEIARVINDDHWKVEGRERALLYFDVFNIGLLHAIWTWLGGLTGKQLLLVLFDDGTHCRSVRWWIGIQCNAGDQNYIRHADDAGRPRQVLPLLADEGCMFFARFGTWMDEWGSSFLVPLILINITIGLVRLRRCRAVRPHSKSFSETDSKSAIRHCQHPEEA